MSEPTTATAVAPDTEAEITLDAASDGIAEFAAEIADQVESFLVAVRAVAKGEAAGSAVPILLLEFSQLLLAGGRLGAIRDVVPADQYEPDPGPDPDLDGFRERLAAVLGDCDAYREVFDPLADEVEVERRRVSDDVALTVADLAHGLAHHRTGKVSEALFWWQFSYLSSWGPAATAATRALLTVVSRSRLGRN